MAIERKDSEFGSRVFIRLLISIVGPSLLLLPFAVRGKMPATRPEMALFAAAPITTAILGCYLLHRLYRRYRCPQCGTKANPEPVRAELRYEHRFYCKQCDIVWQTGVSSGEP
jgi:hypothetical protein